MSKTNIDFDNLLLADSLEKMGLHLINYLFLEGREAYTRHVAAKAANGGKVYTLAQLTAIGCSSPLAGGFNTSIARTARLMLCSYVVGRPGMVESSNDFTEGELCILLGVTWTAEYMAMYTPDLLQVYQQLVAYVNENDGTEE